MKHGYLLRISVCFYFLKVQEFAVANIINIGSGPPPFMMGSGMGAGMGGGMGGGMGAGMGAGMFGMPPMMPNGQQTFGGMGLNAFPGSSGTDGLQGCQSWEKDTGSCGIMGFCFDPKEVCRPNKRCCVYNGFGSSGNSGNGISSDTKSKLQEKLNKEQSKLQKIQEKIKKLQTAINQAG
ncbi:hypothetical protein DdX_17773 [Ditylenchus destructor]|uniref:Uncharacterized protein n=1 Tax=Ditylenchus destructor TaxID=166010 RepID=A0AAD4MLU4_9BILA|nr:hypothetical protein DdX_17773 [Ditylenchus destructor]